MQRRNFIKGSMLAGIALSGNFINDADRRSRFLSVVADPHLPQLSYFSVDSLGAGKLQTNVILKEYFSYPVQPPVSGWKVNVAGKSFELISADKANAAQPFVIKINQHVNHATLLGRLTPNKGEVRLPAVLHFPDMGSFRVTCSVEGAAVVVDAKRFIDEPYVRIKFPAAAKDQPAISYTFEVVSIHPAADQLSDRKFDCFKRNFISIFQLNPFLGLLANNSASDACAFTLYKYAEVARLSPPLAPGLHPLDLIRDSLDQYLAGKKGYGMLGYDYDKSWDIPKSPASCHSLDSYPSLIIAACLYVNSTGDKKWFTENLAGIKSWVKEMLDSDSDGDGLMEFCLSGNSGSWKGDKTMRPANWWDTIGFGHKDAYSNALVYRALLLLQEANERFGSFADAQDFQSRAARLKAMYTDTFYHPETGVLAGWKSADGKLHDYYFTFVSGVAICYGLVEPALANRIMDSMLAKMDEVGFKNFELGLPGNLIPVIRADYTDLVLEAGGGKREDNADGFQIYENGGATACFAYFTIHALQLLGRKNDADKILLPLLKSMSDGNFQGRCPNGRTKDWKTWSGECWGYEGFLVDNYLFLLSVLYR